MALNYLKIVELVTKYFPHPQAVELNKWIDQLRKENENLSLEVKELKKQIEELSLPMDFQPEGVPKCPNCSTVSKPFFMSPLPKDFIEIQDATHECTKCAFSLKVK